MIAEIIPSPPFPGTATRVAEKVAQALCLCGFLNVYRIHHVIQRKSAQAECLCY